MTDTVILRSMNNLAHTILRRMIEGLSGEQVHYTAPSLDARPIVDVVVHAYRGAYFMSYALAEKERPETALEPSTAAELLLLLDRMHDAVDQNLAVAVDGALEKLYKMPWGQDVRGSEALVGALAHSIVHAGSIQGIRAIGGFPTPPER